MHLFDQKAKKRLFSADGKRDGRDLLTKGGGGACRGPGKTVQADFETQRHKKKA